MALQANNFAALMRQARKLGLQVTGAHAVVLPSSLEWRVFYRDDIREMMATRSAWCRSSRLAGKFDMEWPEFEVNRPATFFFTDENTAFAFKMQWG